MKSVLTFCLLLFTISIVAQTTLSGKIINKETNEAPESVSLSIFKNGIHVANTQTDKNGRYSINLDPGIYDVKPNIVDIALLTLREVVLIDGKINPLDIYIDEIFYDCCSIVMRFKRPLIDIDNTSSTGIVNTPTTIKQAATKNIHEISAMAAGVSLQ